MASLIILLKNSNLFGQECMISINKKSNIAFTGDSSDSTDGSSDSSSNAIEWSDDEFDMIINTKSRFYFLTHLRWGILILTLFTN